MPFAVNCAWPPTGAMGKPRGLRCQWPPGGPLFPLSASDAGAAEAEPAPLGFPPAAGSKAGARGDGEPQVQAFGGVDPEVASSIIARAQAAMGSPSFSLASYAAEHDLEVELAAALNEVARARPDKPLQAMAELLPRSKQATPTLPSTCTDDIQRLGVNWHVLNAWHEA